MKPILKILPLLLCATLLHAAPTKHTEESLLALQGELQSSCATIAKAVPCAVGVADVNKLPAALNKSERDARYKLAQSIQAFVSYVATDSTLIADGMAQEFSQVSAKVKIDSLALAGSQVMRTEYGILTDEITGKKFYRVLTLMVLDAKLYAEADTAIAKITDSIPKDTVIVPTDTATVLAAAAPAAKSTPSASAIDKLKAKAQSTVTSTLTNIAKKTGTVLLTLAKRFIGIP
jgi:hypothetical protein